MSHVVIGLDDGIASFQSVAAAVVVVVESSQSDTMLATVSFASAIFVPMMPLGFDMHFRDEREFVVDFCHSVKLPRLHALLPIIVLSLRTYLDN